jgi:hypothetical protein
MTSPRPSGHDRTPTDREIHELFDGELSPVERKALSASRDADEVARKIEGLGEVRAVVRAVAALAHEEPIDSEALWAQIAARIEGAGLERRASTPGTQPAAKEADPPRPALRLVPGGTAEAPATSERGLRVRSRRAIMVGVGALAAAAAAAIAYLGPPDAPRDGGVVATGPTVGGTDLGPILDPTADEQLRRTEVLTVDFGMSAGTVFSVEGEAGARYAVVWLTDEAEKHDDPAPRPL